MSALLAAAKPDLFGRLAIPPVQPIVKWPGRKDRIISAIEAAMPEDTTELTFVEPFMGSGAVLASMTKPFARYELSDVDADIIGLHTACRDDIGALLAAAQPLFAAEQSGELYGAARDALNSGALQGTDRAACYLYLLRASFNGIPRRNSQGLFNTPWGRHSDLHLDRRVLAAWSQRLQGVELECRDFRDAFEQAGEGCVVYADPPYGGGGTFVTYAAGGFSADDQAELAMLAEDAAVRGAHVIISNSAAAADLYEGALSVQRLAVARSVAANGDRTAAEEVLVVYAPKPRLMVGWQP